MTISSGGNPRFKGPGTLFKTSWRRELPLLDMDFFTNFISNADPTKSWYQSAGVAGDNWFFGSVTPGFTIGGAILLPTDFSAAGGAGVASRFNAGSVPREGWLIDVNPTLHLIVSYALDDNSLVVLDGGPITPGVVWPFFIDIYDNGAGTTGKLYIPVAGNLANVAATNVSAPGVRYSRPSAFTPPFVLGLLLPGGTAGAGGMFINGLTNGQSFTPGGTPSANVVNFFEFVKANLTLPVLVVGTNDIYVNATLVYPNAPVNYVTSSPPASQLSQQNTPTLKNVALTVEFAY